MSRDWTQEEFKQKDGKMIEEFTLQSYLYSRLENVRLRKTLLDFYQGIISILGAKSESFTEIRKLLYSLMDKNHIDFPNLEYKSELLKELLELSLETKDEKHSLIIEEILSELNNDCC